MFDPTIVSDDGRISLETMAEGKVKKYGVSAVIDECRALVSTLIMIVGGTAR